MGLFSLDEPQDRREWGNDGGFFADSKQEKPNGEPKGNRQDWRDGMEGVYATAKAQNTQVE